MSKVLRTSESTSSLYDIAKMRRVTSGGLDLRFRHFTIRQIFSRCVFTVLTRITFTPSLLQKKRKYFVDWLSRIMLVLVLSNLVHICSTKFAKSEEEPCYQFIMDHARRASNL
jgi:hypothetical protein